MRPPLPALVGCWLLLSVALFGRDVPLGLDLYMPVPDDNPLTAERVALGRQLFHDRRLSRDQTISCATCHDPVHAFADGNDRAVGVFGRRGTRNAPALINRGYARSFFWDGRTATLEEQVLMPIANPDEMDLALSVAERRVGLSSAEMSRSLATYVRTILSGNSRFDRFAAGDRSALTEQEQQGLQIFRGRGNCTACHVGPTFSDERFHNTGVAWAEGSLSDAGRFAVTQRPEDRGAFRTPTLREIGRTAPYMHDGSLATLEDVVDYYDRGGNANAGLDPELRPLRLSGEDKQALVAFLRALSGEVRDGVR